MFKIEVIFHRLLFQRPAGTSRGIYTDHPVWYVIFRDHEDPLHYGIGECAPLHDLSCDYNSQYAGRLAEICRTTEREQTIDYEKLRSYPSILFGLETALRHYQKRNWRLWETPFSRGEAGIPINGLVWMGHQRFMQKQIESLLSRGFRCVKLKIGAIDFDHELALLRSIRKYNPSDEITLRVDANGSFNKKNALEKLERLAELGIHSIEQPIAAGQWEESARLSEKSPIPIALDEELIGVNTPDEKKKLMETIHPGYIVLKPSLHGGIAGCEEWISIARSTNTGWWITSALESNIGLNSIAQWCSSLSTTIPQGLGTGSLYLNNIPFPLSVKEENLWLDPTGKFPDKIAVGQLRQ